MGRGSGRLYFLKHSIGVAVQGQVAPAAVKNLLSDACVCVCEPPSAATQVQRVKVETPDPQGVGRKGVRSLPPEPKC